jgi:hypothetical protein
LTADQLISLGLDFTDCGFNLLLTSQEHQNITFRLTDVDLKHGADGCFKIITLRLRSIEDLDRERSTRNIL